MAIKNIYWNGTNVFRNSGDMPPFHAEDIDLEDCCCDVCPTDCDACASSYTVSVVSVGNPNVVCYVFGVPPVEVKCNIMVGQSDVVPQVGDTCVWRKGNDAQIDCVDIAGTKYWRATITRAPTCSMQATAPLAGNPCPPTGGVGVWTDIGLGCTGQLSVA